MTRPKPKDAAKVLQMALDTIGMEVERMHDQVANDRELSTAQASSLTDYTKTLLTASAALVKQAADPQLKAAINSNKEQLDALAKEAVHFIESI